MSKFQIIILCIFGAFIIIAVMIFSFSRGSNQAQATVTIWGEMSKSDFDAIVDEIGIEDKSNLTINYSSHPRETMEEDFTEALATGAGPDLIILPLEKYFKNRNKLITIPYKSLSESDFKRTFIEIGELYLSADGVQALPFIVDPIVLYYNRDHLSSAGVASPISYWDEIYASALNLTKKDPAGNITKSAIALGEARNIKNFKGILSLLMLQAGTPITSFTRGELGSELSNNFNLPLVPAEAALDFYTQFSNPSKPYYSWNRSLPEAETRFTAGDSAYYIGFASEYRSIRSKNPTLNFSLTRIPQSRASGQTITYGRLYGISITRGTRNPSAALEAALALVSSEAGQAAAEKLALPPVRRDLLTDRPGDDVLSVFYDAAIQSRGWVDPDSGATANLFQNMIESVTSGRARTSEAVSQASRELDALAQ